tara:strand:- start:137 stop:1618 length:1482 start_codon:yes stop_codon:yes gene_type:complete
MAFKPLTEDKESLQALAFAMRQQKGSDITADELKEKMVNMPGLDSDIKSHCDIDYSKLNSRFNNWINIGSEKDIEDWTNSSVWVANAVIPSQYIKGGGYIFSNTIGDPIFRGAYKQLAKDIAQNAKSSVVKTVYGSMSKGTGDKWNPADVLAIKKSKRNKIVREMESFKKGNPNLNQFKELKTIKQQNKAMGKGFEVVEDMNMLYYYNQFVDKNYKSGDCVPISLKKVVATAKEIKEVTTPSVQIKSFDHKETKGIQDSVNLDLDITNVKFEPTNAKCIVEFTLGGEKGHTMDIRGFQSAINNDVQMQLQKGAAANHGKATLGVFTVITKLSKGRMAFSKQRSFLRKLFPKKKIPSGSSKEKHAFTSYDIFTGYAKNKKGIFSQATFTKDLQSWAEYLEFLSGGKHKKQQVITTLLKLYDKKPVDAAKWLKNKVQSYEVGQVVDKAQSQIADLVKTNIMKSVYSQAASKGFRIFGDKKITDYMTASSYLKVGG